MKKTILSILFMLLANTLIFGAGGGRYSDRNWTDSQVTLNASAIRVNITRSGSLWIQPLGSDCYIAFNATANVSSIKLPVDSGTDFWPANVTNGDYYTLYSASAATANYIIND